MNAIEVNNLCKSFKGTAHPKCEAPSGNMVEGIYQKERTYGRSICISSEG